jgi:hypothetical protein
MAKEGPHGKLGASKQFSLGPIREATSCIRSAATAPIMDVRTVRNTKLDTKLEIEALEKTRYGTVAAAELK